MKPYGYIYLIINLWNNKKYCGKTTKKNVVKYIEDHFKWAFYNSKKVKAKYLYNAIRKYGKQNFKYIILGECYSKEELNESEIAVIYHYRLFGSDGDNYDTIYGYNMTKGGDGIAKGTISHNKGKTYEEMYGFEKAKKLKQQLRNNALGRQYSNEVNKKKGLPGNKNPMYNKHHTQEAKQKIGIASITRNPGKKRLNGIPLTNRKTHSITLQQWYYIVINFLNKTPIKEIAKKLNLTNKIIDTRLYWLGLK